MFERSHDTAAHGVNAFRNWLEVDAQRTPAFDAGWKIHAHVSTLGEWQRTSPHLFDRKSPASLKREPQGHERGLAEIFEGLVGKWRKETAFHSALVLKFRHPAYQAIISLGKEVLPLIFARLEDGGNSWGYALKEITGVNPAIHTDNPKDAATAWLKWWQHENPAR